MKNYFENTTVKSSFSDKLTWPAHSPKYQYDYIFFRKNASLGGVKIIRDNNTQNTSDHLPLIAEFELK
jgi:endonuclease/exonuclease/phosphatase family metal-dependent hydrolase